ncbi:DnaB-like helicase C-terminal domain-containing protein [Paenibacillus chitinolyticus]|uniref:DnaB-like helicase C-terminal domain-containing protein n=1 Tax=Paenibacillus chitinolyticus TaxID=79263 RepID=UPI003D01C591
MEKAIKNINAERIVVGILLNHPSWLIELNGLMKPEYFWAKGHRMLFYIVFKLLEEGVESIDSMAILARAEKIQKATDVINENGGIEYIEELRILSEDYKLDDLKMYAQDVTTASFKRDSLIMQENVAKQLVDNPDMTYSDVVMLLQEKQAGLVNRYSHSGGLKFLNDVFDVVWGEVESNWNERGYAGLPPKWELVRRFFTYLNGELIVIGARAKYGKSNFAINETHHLAVENNVPVGYFDTEMKTRTFLTRIVAIDSGVPAEMILNGTYRNDVDMIMQVEASKERVRKAPILHKYDAHWDKAKISHEAKLLKMRHNIGFLIWDYIKIKEVGSTGTKEHNELGNWTIFLKDLAGDLDIPVLTFAQLSPHERRLADSDKINRYCSTVAYLLPKSSEEISRDFGAENGGTDFLFVDYNRNGSTMSDPAKGVNFFYDRETLRMEQASYQVLVDEYQ